MRGRSPGSGAHPRGTASDGCGGSGGEGCDGMRRLMLWLRRMAGVRVGATGRAEVCGGIPVVVVVSWYLFYQFLRVDKC